MTYYTHINRGVIDANRKNGRDDPPVTFRRGKRGRGFGEQEMALQSLADALGLQKWNALEKEYR